MFIAYCIFIAQNAQGSELLVIEGFSHQGGFFPCGG